MSAITPDETVLGLLAAQARHGYQLLDCFQDPRKLGRVWKLSTSQLYNVLKRLEREGAIVGCEVASESGPPRTEYTLSAAGQARLSAWLNEPNPSSSIRRVRVEFLSRLFIAHALALPTSAIVHRQREACLRERERLAAEHSMAQSSIESLTLAFVVEQLDGVLRWLSTCETLLASN